MRIDGNGLVVGCACAAVEVVMRFVRYALWLRRRMIESAVMSGEFGRDLARRLGKRKKSQQ